MNERDIFLAAVEKTDRAQRAAYLDQVCAGDASLRKRVDELLTSHDRAGEFLETPVPAKDSVIGETILSGRDGSSEAAGRGVTDAKAEARAEFCRYLGAPRNPNSLGSLGHYEIEEILGSGAFGIVAKAFDTKLHRVVAIKMMRPAIAATSPPRKRFLREARTAAAITHENVIAIHAVEEAPIPYIVMEYILGQSLEERLRGNGPLEPEEVVRIGGQIAAGLGAAHAVNLIHRDIKPANILLADGPETRVKLSDFGLARAVDDASLTRSGMITGTPMYMAPEQARGERLDHRADLFSLGSVLYQMASGRPPFRAANTVAVLKRVCEDAPRALDDVIPQTPAWLQNVIFCLLEKEPASRYQSAREVADLLSGFRQRLGPHDANVLTGAKAAGAELDISASVGFPGILTRGSLLAAGMIIGIALLALAVLLTPADFDVDSLDGLQKASNPTKQLAPAEDVSGEDKVPIAGGEAGSSQLASAIVSDAAWGADSPEPAVAPFDAEAAAAHQRAWADFLGIPVEYENTIGMKLILIPPGQFLMGMNDEQLGRATTLASDDPVYAERIGFARPQHLVLLTKPFYIGRTEVTQAEYGRVTGRWPSELSATGPRSRWVAGLDTETHPVETVSWNDAAEFCSRLSELEMMEPRYVRAGESVDPIVGAGYRLPTEAEWEFACRAGTTTRFWSGDKTTDLYRAAWFGQHSENRTHSVGERASNPFGLFDVHGNVFEWVEDGWSSDVYGLFGSETAVDPAMPFSGAVRRVCRGGGWAESHLLPCYASYRRPQLTTYKTFDIGFRVVLPVERN